MYTLFYFAEFSFAVDECTNARYESESSIFEYEMVQHMHFIHAGLQARPVVTGRLLVPFISRGLWHLRSFKGNFTCKVVASVPSN